MRYNNPAVVHSQVDTATAAAMHHDALASVERDRQHAEREARVTAQEDYFGEREAALQRREQALEELKDQLALVLVAVEKMTVNDRSVSGSLLL